MKTLTSWKLGFSFAGAIVLGALATLPARAQNYPTILAGQSPLDWWRFDETTPSAAVETVTNLGSAGAAGNGYVVNAGYQVTGTNGIIGNGVYLSNPGQDTGFCYTRIDIPNITALNPEPPFTVEFWAMPNSPFNPSDSTGVCPVSSDSPFPLTATTRSGYLFYVVASGWTLRVGGEASYTAVVTANVTVSTNSFTHVVGEFDGSTAWLYLNGVLAASAPAAGGPFHRNTWVPTRIGGTSLGGDTGEEYGDVNGYEPFEAG